MSPSFFLFEKEKRSNYKTNAALISITDKAKEWPGGGGGRGKQRVKERREAAGGTYFFAQCDELHIVLSGRLE